MVIGTRTLMVAACTLAACGRLSFVDSIDALDVSFIRFPMDNDPATGMVAAIPAARSVTCTVCPSLDVEHVVGTGAYAFAGTQRVTLGDVVSTTSPFTIAVWLRPSASTTFASTISKPLDTTTVLNDISLTVFDAFAFEGTKGGAITEVKGTDDIRGAWHHVALVFDGSVRSVYVDGQFEASVAGPWDTSALPVGIGGDLDANVLAAPYTGLMDDLRLYATALDASTIAAVIAER